MRLRERGERRSSRGSAAALLALAALVQAGAASAGPVSAEATGAAATGGGEETAAPREVVFVVDLSTAMRGAPLEQAKEALAAALGRLRPVDTFNVLALGERTRALYPASWPAGPESLARAARWIAGLETEESAEALRGLADALGPPDAGYSVPGTRAVREVIVFAPGALGGGALAGAGTAAAAGHAAGAQTGAVPDGRTLPPPAPAANGTAPVAHAAAVPAAGAPAARADGHTSGTVRERRGAVGALVLRLGAGLAVFAAALAYALRRGLTTAQAVR